MGIFGLGLDARETARIQGIATITLRDEGGEVEVWRGWNTVVDLGLNLLLERLINTTGASPMSHLAIGSGTRSTVNTAGSLYNEVYRKALTSASVSGNVATFKTYLTSAQAAGETIREMGLTNSAASGKGTLFNYFSVSPAVEKAAGKEAVITITNTLTRS